MLFLINIDKYINLECIVSEDLLLCPIEYKKVDFIVSNNIFYIDTKKYYYEIYSISEDIEKKGNLFYKEIALQSNIKEKNIDFNVVRIRVKIYKKNIYLYIKDLIGGEINEET